MADGTAIEWADATFNPWVGCTKVSPACDHCYAESWAKRTGHPELWTGERRRTSAANWLQPLKWDKKAFADGVRRKVFCASLADVFDNQVPPGWRNDLWRLIERTPSLDWLLLTKRPQNIAKMLPNPDLVVKPWGNGWPNVWLGTTAEDQKRADQNIPDLLETPAAVRFVSLEPLLGAITLWADNGEGLLRGPGVVKSGGVTVGTADCPPEGYDDSYPGIDWVIVGGESGPHARPMHPGWARSLRDQCAAAGVPYFFKQWGQWAPRQTEDYKPDDIALDVRGTAAGHIRSLGEMQGPAGMSRVGKRAAGRLLDGVEHNGMPA